MKLMLVNSGEKFEKLFRRAKKMEPKLTRKEFVKALENYYNQHEVLPDKITKIPDKVAKKLDQKKKVYIKIADMNVIPYTTERGRKKDILWIHKTKGGMILSDVDGNIYYAGKTKVNKDGWLVD